MDKYYPIMLDIKGKECKVIGGGKVAERKVTALLDCGASVTVISPLITHRLERYHNNRKITLIQRKYMYGDLDESWLVYAATDDELVNRTCLRECKEKGILLNVVDRPQMCDFIVPASISRGHLNISISTNGKSPMLSRKIRENLEKMFTEEYEEYLEILGDLREIIKKEVNDIEKRREIFRTLVYSDIFDRYLDGEDMDLKEELYKFYKLRGVEFNEDKRNNNRQQRK